MLVKNLVKQGQHLGSYDSGIVWFEKLEKFENLKIRNSSLVSRDECLFLRRETAKAAKFKIRISRAPFSFRPRLFYGFCVEIKMGNALSYYVFLTLSKHLLYMHNIIYLCNQQGHS